MSKCQNFQIQKPKWRLASWSTKGSLRLCRLHLNAKELVLGVAVTFHIFSIVLPFPCFTTTSIHAPGKNAQGIIAKKATSTHCLRYAQGQHNGHPMTSLTLRSQVGTTPMFRTTILRFDWIGVIALQFFEPERIAQNGVVLPDMKKFVMIGFACGQPIQLIETSFEFKMLESTYDGWFQSTEVSVMEIPRN